MELKVKCSTGGYKLLNAICVGDLVLCEDDQFHPVISVIKYACYYYLVTTSTLDQFVIPETIKMKTSTGFKFPELADVLITDKFTPFIYSTKKDSLKSIFSDILTEVPMKTKNGYVVRFDSGGLSGQRETSIIS